MNKVGEVIGLYAAAAGLVAGITWGQGAIADSSYGKDRAQEYVEQFGYTDVEFEDKDTVLVSVRGCGSSDAVQYEFSGTAPNGQDVDIAVCKGLFKAATIRQG